MTKNELFPVLVQLRPSCGLQTAVNDSIHHLPFLSPRDQDTIHAAFLDNAPKNSRVP